jgi:hypothetical protein
MTASLFRAVGGNGLAPASCDRTVPVFDGHMRYDLRLNYKRTEQVKAPKGYAGPALVCAIRFRPIAGHDPGRLAIRWLTELRDMEIWLAPIVGTPILVPFRFTVPTPFGLGLIEATQFVSGPQVAHPTPTSAKLR